MNGPVSPEGYRAEPFPHWRQGRSRVSACFTGRIAEDQNPERSEVLRRLDGAPAKLAWLQQTHSSKVRAASTGACGEGDGLWTEEPGLALSLVTADCVPIICGSDQTLAAIHAGWRGLVAGVIQVTLAELPGEPSELDAWLGPAIGPCCYEVGNDIAGLVAKATEPSVVKKSPGARPHVDLHHAAAWQLRRHGVRRIHRITRCTRCNPNLLWSLRGASGTNGSNLTFAWLSS